MRIRHVQIGESLTNVYRPSYDDELLHNLFKAIISLIEEVTTHRKPWNDNLEPPRQKARHLL